jgi:hypothetical protein
MTSCAIRSACDSHGACPPGTTCSSASGMIRAARSPTLNDDRFSNAKPVERAHRIRKERDAGTDRVDAWGPLEHDILLPRTAQCNRCAQAAYPSPHDNHAHGSGDPTCALSVQNAPGLL